jgi:hypothetical protein
VSRGIVDQNLNRLLDLTAPNHNEAEMNPKCQTCGAIREQTS